MYKKNFLSLIGLALVGKAFAEVTLPTCNDIKGATFTPADCKETTGTVANYCIDSEKVYKVISQGDGTISCYAKPLEAGLYVFKVEAAKLCIPLTNKPVDWNGNCGNYFKDENCITEVTGTCTSVDFNSGTHKKKLTEVTGIDMAAAGTIITDADKVKIVLYNCDGTQCEQTSGYIKDSNKIFTVSKNGGAVQTVDTNKVAACNKDTSGSPADSTGNLIVGDGSDFKLCITGTAGSEVEANGNIYRMEEKALNIFTGGVTHVFITIKTQTNIFAYDEIAVGMDLKPCAEYNKSVFVAGTDPASCTSTDPHVNFCVHGTKIYSLSGANSCRSAFKFTVAGTPSTLVNYLELTNGKLNAVKIDGTEKKDDLSGTINNIQNYILVDCVSGVCRQTQGYLKNGYAFIGTEAGKPAGSLIGSSINTEVECTSNVGMLDKTGINICVLGNKFAPFAENGNKYMISQGQVSGSPFKDSNGVALKISSIYIIKDKFNSEVNLYFSDDATIYDKSKFDSKKTDLETQTSVSKFSLYDCNEGVCKQTSGYIKSGTDIYAFVGIEPPVKANIEPFIGNPVIDSNTGCGEGKEGKLIADASGICYGDSGKDVQFTNSGEERIFLKGVATEGTPFYETKYSIAVRRDLKYIARDQFYNAGVVLVEKASGTIISDLSTPNTGITQTPGNNVLLDCVDGVCLQTVGYIRNGTGVVAFVGENGGADATTSTFKSSKAAVTNCDGNTVGMLISSVNAVCLGHGDTADTGKGVVFGDVTNQYLVKKGTAAVGTPFRDDKYDVPIKSDLNYIVRDRYYSLFSLFNKENYSIVDKDSFNGENANLKHADKSKNYYIYDCMNGDCKQTSGYIKSGSDVIAFVGNNYAVSDITGITGTGSGVASCVAGENGKISGTTFDGVCFGISGGILFTSPIDKYIMLKGMAAKDTPFEDNINSVAIKRDPAFIVRDQFYTAVNLVSKADGTIITNFAQVLTITDKVIVDCEEGVCKQTQGYIRDGSTPKALGYAFVGEEAGDATGTKAKFVGSTPIKVATGCTSTSVGQIITDESVGVTSICYGEGSKVIKFEEGTARNIILKGKAFPGTPFADRVNDVAIKHTANYIIRDRFYTAVSLVKKEDGSVETDFTKKLEITNEDKILIDCVDGACTQTQGYLKNNGKMYKFIGDESGVAVNAGCGSGCSSNNVGKYLSDKSGICIASGKSVAFEAKDDAHMIMKGEGVKGTPFENEKEMIAVKRSANYVVIDQHLTTIKLVKKDEGTLHETNVADLFANPDRYIIAECVEGKCRQTQGYIKGTSTVIGFIGTSSGQNVASKLVATGVDVKDKCTKNHIGKFFVTTYSDVCIKDKVSIKFDDEQDTFILMNDENSAAVAGTPFEDPGSIVPIKRGGKHYIIRDQFYTAVNLVKVVDGTVISDQNLSNEEVSLGGINDNYVLVDCVDGVCKQTKGYVVDKVKGIAFKDKNSGVTVVGDTNYQVSDCSGKDGMIKESSGEYTGVCINDIEVTFGSIGKHIILGDAEATTPFKNGDNYVPVKHGDNYFVVEMFESVNLYKTANQVLTEDINSEYSDLKAGVGTGGTAYKIVDCKSGICKGTNGLVKAYGDDIYKFIYNSAYTVAADADVAASVKEDIDCNDDNIGKLFSDKSGICYMYGASLKFGEKSGVHMIMGGTAATGTLFASADNGYPVKSGNDFIVIDQYIDEVNFVKVADQSVINEFTTEKVASDYIITDCEGNKCRQTSGYVLNGSGNKVFSFVGSKNGEDVTNGGVSSSALSCTNDLVGKYIKEKGEFCITNQKALTLSTKQNSKIMVLEGKMGVNTPFGGSTNYIKYNTKYVIIDKFEQITNGVFMVSVKDGTVIGVVNGNLAKIESTSVGDSVIVQCDDVKKECKQTYGYISTAAETVYMFNSAGVGSEVTSDTVDAIESCADNTNVGMVYLHTDSTTKKGICFGSNSNIIDFGDNKSFVMLKGKAKVGTPFEDAENNVSIKAGPNDSFPKYIIVDRYATDGVSLVDKDTGEVTAISSPIVENTYLLFDCESGICKQTEGYVKDGAKVLAFVGEGINAVGNEYTSEISTLVQCTNANMGKFYGDSSGGLCVYNEETYRTSVTFGENTEDLKYIVKGGVAGTPFANGNYVIKKGSQYLVKDLFYNSGDYCTYATILGEARKTSLCKKGVLKEYYNCVNGVCTSKTDGKNNVDYGIYLLNVNGKDTMYKCGHKKCWPEEHNGMYVFEITESEERVMLDDAKLDALTGITRNKKIIMTQCVKGICEPIVQGFIKYGKGSSTIADYSITAGTITVTPSSFVKCEGEPTDSGKLKSNMDMCTDGALKKTEAIVGVGVLFGGPPKKLYQRTGYNVVGTVISGNYKIESNVAECVESSCSIIEDTDGYYINSDFNTNDEYELIYCETVSTVVKCEYRHVVENGYYWKKEDVGSTVTICDNDGCRVTPITIAVTNCGVSSGVNKNKLIYETSGGPGTFKYCKDGTSSGGVTIDGLKYYVARGTFEPRSKFNYPTRFVRTDVPESEILIKTQPYSVTVVTGDNIPIGYVKVGDSYLECGFNEEGKNVCVIADVTETECKLETTGKLITSGGTKLCVDPSIDPVDISTSAGEYLIALGNGKFGIANSRFSKRNDGKEYFIGVKITPQNITVVKEPVKIKYKYTATDAETHTKSLFKIYDRLAASGSEALAANGICDATASGPGKSFEYETVVWTVGSGAIPEIDYYIPGDNSNLQA